MNAIGIFILSGALATGILASRASGAPRGLSVVALLLISAQLLLAEQSIGPVPLRLVAFVVGFIYLCVDALVFRICLRTREEITLASIWLVYALAAFIAQWSNGTISGGADLIDFASRHGYAILTLILVAGLARSRGAALIAGWLFGIAFLNFCFVLAQLIKVPGALVAHDLLYPSSKSREAALVAEGLITSFGYLPGLSPYSIVTGYVLTIFGTLGIGLGNLRGGATSNFASVISGVMMILGGAIILSRSTILIGGAAILVALVWSAKSRHSRFALLLTLFMATVAMLPLGFLLLDQAAASIPGFQRVQSLGDNVRLRLFSNSFNYFVDHPLIGGAPAMRFVNGLPIGAHNFLLNGGISFGLVGLVPLLLLVAASVAEGWKAVYRSKGQRLYPVVTCGFISMLAYLAKGLFHNESLVTSGIFYAMLTGLTIGAASSIRYSRGPASTHASLLGKGRTVAAPPGH